jgi:hypothetical protein
VEIRRAPDPGHIDPVVLDPITQYFVGKLFRVWHQSGYYSSGGGLLHRLAWESAFGPIPPRHHIHHRDSNPANNAISNLECLPAREHCGISSQASRDAVVGRARRPDGTLGPVEFFTDAARDKAAAWHSSDAGREWHRQHAVRSKSWTKWKRSEKPCAHCGKLFLGLDRAGANSQKFCTVVCKAADYRARREAAAA